MKDILIEHDGLSIECDIDGLDLLYTWSDEPKRHIHRRLRSKHSYRAFKNAVNELYDSNNTSDDGWWDVSDYLQSYDMRDFFEDEPILVETDPRDPEEIYEYLEEAFDKVWLMRSRPCDEHPDIEADRQAAVKRILRTYDDIPANGYSDWECGYWNGIMGALRWVMGDDKNFLDT